MDRTLHKIVCCSISAQGGSQEHLLCEWHGIVTVEQPGSLQTSELVDEVTCIVDAKHSLLPCIVFVYQKSEVRKKSYLQL